MQIINKDITKHYHLLSSNIKKIFSENAIIFDIETTGFSSKFSSIYLIGMIYKQADNIILTQLFCDSLDDEKECLLNFFNLLKAQKEKNDSIKLITFNGDHFDIPFIKQRAENYFEESFINSTFNHSIFSYDIFKKISKLKSFFNLENYKQKTVENFLGINRIDTYNGGELIDVYKNYVVDPSNSSEQLELLLQHNHDDVIYLLSLLDIISYEYILTGEYTLSNVEQNTYLDINNTQQIELFFTLKNNFIVPNTINYRYHNIYLKFNNNQTTIRVPVYCGVLKHFYSDYKNYYFLENDGYAIHSSLASFLPSDKRKKATARTAYQLKEGIFLPTFNDDFEYTFKHDYDSNTTYFLTDANFFSNYDCLCKYVHHITKSICSELKIN
ncbi:ribonuclease H-like domain-containing protein [Lachnobacterium bovis]|uniref:ribonuclease H-like domain-containing protein n=1 Tax=Lachnobacterium bovis TaxID=140626 RepID=UPI00048EEA28|nr:ribonuclease H-like domain-containing protein [Lachnobacterium bovis]